MDLNPLHLNESIIFHIMDVAQARRFERASR